MVDKEEFYAFIESKVGVEICDSTAFFEEIGIDGLDATTLMDEIFTYYKTDISDYIDNHYHDHESELFNPFFYIKSFITGKNKKKQFTAKHLFHVVNKGSWFNP